MALFLLSEIAARLHGDRAFHLGKGVGSTGLDEHCIHIRTHPP